MRVVVTGGGGFIGSALITRLEAEGHSVQRLSRGPSWDPRGGVLDPSLLEGADAVVHLAGAGVAARRWTPAYKEEVRESRTRGTSAVAEAVASQPRPPALVCASAIGYYGVDRGPDLLTEEEPPGTDFLGRLCTDWEAAADPARQAGARVVHLRTGLVLAAAGGVLRAMLIPFRLGLGGRLGDGRQYQSWITRHDAVGAVSHLLESDAAGPFNLTAPVPVTNRELTAALGRALRRPAVMTVPAFALHLALGREMATETVLAGQRAVPRALEADGFRFSHPELGPALEAALADR